MRGAWRLLVFAIGAAACAGTRADEGRDALLQIEGAQFYRDAMPVAEAGPRVISASIVTRARAGVRKQAAGGALETAATAIAIGLGGDVGYWVLPAKVPLSSAPTLPTFEASFGVAASAAPGRRDLVLRAVDGAGRFGPPLVRPLDIAASLGPTGRLVISLSWDNHADLDLHVVLPSGVEIFKRNRTEYERPPPSAGPVAPDAPIDGGLLDRDSNAMCVPDGQSAENVVWTDPPPAGHYVVRVDTFSLCNAPSARWRVEATLDGARIAAAQGTSTDVDARFAHNRGGGVTALELDVP